MIAPKKSLGQNFLRDDNVCRKIVRIALDNNPQNIIEIGPGTGALTRILVESGKNILAIETDSRAVDYLNYELGYDKISNFKILKQDILKTNLIKLPGIDFSLRTNLIGNIPYNISSQILFLAFENVQLFDKAVFTMQKELAQRLCGKSGTKDFGVLTLACQASGIAKIEFDIKPGLFYPPPKVVSSVVSFRPNPVFENSDEFFHFMKFVKAAFSQRRKFIKNSLKNYFSEIGIKAADFDLLIKKLIDQNKIAQRDFGKIRAEAIPTNEFIEIFREIQRFIP